MPGYGSSGTKREVRLCIKNPARSMFLALWDPYPAVATAQRHPASLATWSR